MYIGDSNEILNALPANEGQTALVLICHFQTQSHIYHIQYMLQTLTADSLWLQLHIVGSRFFRCLSDIYLTLVELLLGGISQCV